MAPVVVRISDRDSHSAHNFSRTALPRDLCRRVGAGAADISRQAQRVCVRAARGEVRSPGDLLDTGWHPAVHRRTGGLRAGRQNQPGAGVQWRQGDGVVVHIRLRDSRGRAPQRRALRQRPFLDRGRRNRPAAQIELPQAAKVAKVVFSRDRTGKYKDRLPGDFEILVSMDQKNWRSVYARSAAGMPLPSASQDDLVRYAWSCEAAAWPGAASSRSRWRFRSSAR